MRISDWSSDVCPSDLQDAVLIVLDADGGGIAQYIFTHTTLAVDRQDDLVARFTQQIEDGFGIFRVLLDFQFATAANIAPQFRTQRSEEHTSELQSLMRISYAVFCLTKKNTQRYTHNV